MTEELIIEQPQGGLWLNPGKRVGHLVAIINVRSKEKLYDDLAEKERDVAEFDFVDLDEEKALMSGSDNHPGITSRLRVGNPAVVLGRIGFQPSRTPGQKDALVLGEHAPADAALFRAWHADRQAGRAWQPASTPVGVPQATQPAPAPVPPAPAPAPAPVPVPQAVPATADGGDLLASMSPETLALIAKAMQQTGANPNGQ